jgi:hypothetical protein
MDAGIRRSELSASQSKRFARLIERLLEKEMRSAGFHISVHRHPSAVPSLFLIEVRSLSGLEAGATQGGGPWK